MKFAKGVNLVKKADFNQIKILLQSETSNENKLTNVNKHFQKQTMVKELMNAYYLLKEDEE